LKQLGGEETTFERIDRSFGPIAARGPRRLEKDPKTKREKVKNPRDRHALQAKVRQGNSELPRGPRGEVFHNHPVVGSSIAAIRNSGARARVSGVVVAASICQLHPNSASIEVLSVDLPHCIRGVLLCLHLYETILSLQVDVPQLSKALEQSLDVTLPAVMAKVAEEQPWHCGPSDLLTATGRLADNVTKTFLTLLMQ